MKELLNCGFESAITATSSTLKFEQVGEKLILEIKLIENPNKSPIFSTNIIMTEKVWP